jgi:hypothetical protein
MHVQTSRTSPARRPLRLRREQIKQFRIWQRFTPSQIPVLVQLLRLSVR